MMSLFRFPPSSARRLLAGVSVVAAMLGPTRLAVAGHGDDSVTQPPIKHVVVIFQENVSFDHYFATYPDAANSSSNEPRFRARRDTPRPNGLSGSLLTANPNSTNPFRLDRSHAATC